VAWRRHRLARHLILPMLRCPPQCAFALLMHNSHSDGCKTECMSSLEPAVAAALPWVLQESFKRMHSFSLGDSAEPGQKARYTVFFARLAKFAALEEPWTVIIR
jgi:hypothetical protein